MRRPQLSPWRRLPLLAVLGAGLFSGLSCRQVLDPTYCARSSDCATDGGTALVCAGLTHTCVPQGVGACSADQDCSDPGVPRCDNSSGQCMPCIVGDNTPCPAGQPFCTQIGATTRCVACNSNIDCPYEQPICNPDHSCRKCQEHSDCGPTVNCYDLRDGVTCQNSWVCIQPGDLAEQPTVGGRCAISGVSMGTQLVAYVVGGAGPPQCDNQNSSATADSPVCTINEALTMAGRSPSIRYIRMTPAQDYAAPPAALPSGHNLILIGAPYPGGQTPAHVLVGMNNTITVTSGANITLDQVDVFLQQAGTAIQCSYDSTLKLQGSIVTGSNKMMDMLTTGISLSNCNVVLDRNYIGVHPTRGPGPLGVAIQVLDSDGGAHNYQITNNVIADNMGAALDLSSADAVGTANIQVAFNTIVNNGQQPMAFGGVLCPAATPVLLSYSIIDNNPGSGSSQFFGKCTFQQVAVGGAAPMTTVPGQIYGDPVFTAAPPGHLDVSTALNRAANTACCIDKVPAGSLPSPPAIDIDGTARPQGPGFDIGAVEVPYPLPNN